MKNLFEKKSWLIALLISGIFLLIFWRTCCRTVFWWDSAEFVAAVATSGIPHPPGFPLYMLMGKVFSLLPFFSLAFKLNFLSGLLSALSLGILYLLFLKFCRIFHPDSGKKTRLLVFSSILLILVTGLNYAFWIQGVRAEVYSLNGLLFVILFFCGLNFLSGTKEGVKKNIYAYGRFRWAYLFFFVLGLGMGNHNVTLLSTLPAFVFLFLSYDSHAFLKARNLAIYFVFFLLGCSVYLYLPFRAINSPGLNWGDPVNLKGVLTSALALKSFKQIGFALDYSLWERTKDAWSMIYSQLTLFPFLLSLTGLFLLLRNNLKLFFFFLLLIMGNVSTIIVLPSELISTSSDFQGYILPAIFSLGLLFGLGVFRSLGKIGEWLKTGEFSPGFKKSLVIVASFFFCSISLLPFLTYYRLADLSQDDLACRYGKDVLSNVKKNAVVILDNPNLYFILSALRYGEGYREDVAVLDRGLLLAEWNCRQERRNYPRVFSGVPSGLRGEELIRSLIGKGLARDLPLYMEYTQRDTDFVDFLLPSGHLFKMEKRIIATLSDKIITQQEEFEKEYFAQKDERSFQNDLDAQRMFVYVTYRWGAYYERRGMLKEALRNFYLAWELDPFNLELQQKVEGLKYRIQLAKN